MNQLTACAGCRRHVRTSEVRCPFCGTARRAAKRTPWIVAVGVGLSTLAYACACYGAPPCMGPGCLTCDDIVCSDAAAPTDAGPPGLDSGTDAGSDASTDTGADASTDSAAAADAGTQTDASDGG